MLKYCYLPSQVQQKMFGEAKGFFDGLAAVFDTADNTVATRVWNVIFEKKKFCKVSNEIDLTFDQQKRVWIQAIGDLETSYDKQ